jgi:hypothetical protein
MPITIITELAGHRMKAVNHRTPPSEIATAALRNQPHEGTTPA